MLVSQRFGVHSKVTQSNARTLQNAKYRVRTDLGISETSYSHSEDDPIYGTGQGSGNSSQTWGFLSSVISDIYESRAAPASYCNPDRSRELKIAMIGFVDDNNGQTNRFMVLQDRSTLEWMVARAEENATLWALLLEATGGALELSKCSYHIVFWKFSMQGAPVLTNMSSEVPPIKVTDTYTGNLQELQHLSPYTAHKTLGHHKEPAGVQAVQYKSLKEKSDSITDFLRRTPLSRTEAWTYYTACYIPSICYPLTASFMSPKQLTDVQKKAMSIIIPQCGFNRHTHRAIIYGPRSLGGANFRLLHVEQGLLQVTYFIRHCALTQLTCQRL